MERGNRSIFYVDIEFMRLSAHIMVNSNLITTRGDPFLWGETCPKGDDIVINVYVELCGIF